MSGGGGGTGLKGGGKNGGVFGGKLNVGGGLGGNAFCELDCKGGEICSVSGGKGGGRFQCGRQPHENVEG